MHWDHIGESRDFPSSKFVVGHGALALLDGTPSGLSGGHSFFEKDLLPKGRTIELLDPNSSPTSRISEEAGIINFNREWRKHGSLPKVLDLFNDGTIFIVDAPGHLPGHINLLAYTSSKIHPIYLAGDTCHDRRLLTGEKQISTWEDAEGRVCCIHADRWKGHDTIKMVRILEGEGVEVVLAHDGVWEERNGDRFFGAEPDLGGDSKMGSNL